jgi:uroporphyrinogen-III synthase
MRLRIVGSHTGNSDSLAQFIISHYDNYYSNLTFLPSLLFVTGSKHSGALSKCLMQHNVVARRRIYLHKLIVYSINVRDSLARDLKEELVRTRSSLARWIIFFSPAGCEAVIDHLNLLDHTASIATIGPTTYRYLQSKLGISAAVSASKPDPLSLLNDITHYIRSHIV